MVGRVRTGDMRNAAEQRAVYHMSISFSTGEILRVPSFGSVVTE